MRQIVIDMNLQAEKIKLIEWLVGINDATLLQKLSKLKTKSVKEAYEANLRPMKIEEQESRAAISNKNIEQGEVYDIEEILK